MPVATGIYACMHARKYVCDTGAIGVWVICYGAMRNPVCTYVCVNVCVGAGGRVAGRGGGGAAGQET